MLSKKALGISPSPTLAIDSKAKEMKSKGINVVSFGAGEPDFDTPPHIREAAIRAINEGYTRYTPAAGMPELKEAICKKLHVDNGLDYEPAQIVVSNGAKHSLYNVMSTLLNQGDEVLVPEPYWVSYPEMVRLADGIPVPVKSREENLFKITAADLEKVCTMKCKALIINSPSNPTGQIYSIEELQEIARFCVDHNIYIITDEVYEKLIYGGSQHVSIASLSNEVKALTIVVNGASKSFAMTGWRIGYTASNLEIAKVMANIQSHTTSNPNSIAQKAVVAALQGPQECVEEMRLAFDERRRFMFQRVSEIPYLNAIEPLGAFYMFVGMEKAIGKNYRNITITDSDNFAALLLEDHKVAVVPGTGFGSPNHMRFSFATSMDNIAEGLDRIEAFVSKLT